MARMPPTKKRKTTRKAVSQPKRSRRVGPLASAAGREAQRSPQDVVNQVEKTLEGIPKQLRKTARKTKKVASRSRVVANVVHALEEVPKTIRKAAKKTRARTARLGAAASRCCPERQTLG